MLELLEESGKREEKKRKKAAVLLSHSSKYTKHVHRAVFNLLTAFPISRTPALYEVKKRQRRGESLKLGRRGCIWYPAISVTADPFLSVHSLLPLPLSSLSHAHLSKIVKEEVLSFYSPSPSPSVLPPVSIPNPWLKL